MPVSPAGQVVNFISDRYVAGSNQPTTQKSESKNQLPTKNDGGHQQSRNAGSSIKKILISFLRAQSAFEQAARYDASGSSLGIPNTQLTNGLDPHGVPLERLDKHLKVKDAKDGSSPDFLTSLLAESGVQILHFEDHPKTENGERLPGMLKPLVNPYDLFHNNRLDHESLAELADKHHGKEVYRALIKASYPQPFLRIPDRKAVGENVRPNEEQAKSIVDTYVRFLKAYDAHLPVKTKGTIPPIVLYRLTNSEREDWSGFFDSRTHSVYVNEADFNSGYSLRTLNHELLHAFSSPLFHEALKSFPPPDFHFREWDPEEIAKGEVNNGYYDFFDEATTEFISNKVTQDYTDTGYEGQGYVRWINAAAKALQEGAKKIKPEWLSDKPQGDVSKGQEIIEKSYFGDEQALEQVMEVYTSMLNDFADLPKSETPRARPTPIPLPKRDKAGTPKSLADAKKAPVFSPDLLFYNNRLDPQSFKKLAAKHGGVAVYDALIKVSLYQSWRRIPDARLGDVNVRPNEDQAKLVVDIYVRFLEAYYDHLPLMVRGQVPPIVLFKLDDPKYVGFFYTRTRAIHMNAAHFSSAKYDYSLRTLNHELLHAFVSPRFIDAIYSFPPPGWYKREWDEDEIAAGKVNNGYFDVFDEATTEFISNKVTQNYMDTGYEGDGWVRWINAAAKALQEGAKKIKPEWLSNKPQGDISKGQEIIEKAYLGGQNAIEHKKAIEQVMEIFTSIINDFADFPDRGTPRARKTPFSVPKWDKKAGPRKEEL
jgi:hypothetical protein